jgi:hypothetical protein
MNVRRITAAAVATGALATGLVAAAGTADASGAASPTVTAVASDSTPASGQEFVVTGKFTAEGAPVAGRSVKVQSLRGTTWSQLTGAIVSTRSDGTYRVRVILSARGERTLRVVADAPGDLPNAKRRFTVTVH